MTNRLWVVVAVLAIILLVVCAFDSLDASGVDNERGISPMATPTYTDEKATSVSVELTSEAEPTYTPNPEATSVSVELTQEAEPTPTLFNDDTDTTPTPSLP